MCGGAQAAVSDAVAQHADHDRAGDEHDDGVVPPARPRVIFQRVLICARALVAAHGMFTGSHARPQA